MKIRLMVAALALLVSQRAIAQSAAEHVAMGDRERAASNATSALQHYEAAIKAEPSNHTALWKASGEAVELGEFQKDAELRTRLYRTAEQYARRAVQANPTDAEGHFALARALGRAALTLGAKERIKYAGEVREHALEALKLNPKHAGALHVMGVWNAEVMRLNGIQRMFAKNFLGGQVFGQANWKEAVRYMESAVALEPNRITHRLDLAKVYEDVGDKAKAREQYQTIARMPVSEHNDRSYKADAEERLRKLG